MVRVITRAGLRKAPLLPPAMYIPDSGLAVR
jgi:hypothetical protein